MGSTKGCSCEAGNQSIILLHPASCTRFAFPTQKENLAVYQSDLWASLCSVDENGAFIDIGAKAAAFLPTSNISTFKLPRVSSITFHELQTNHSNS